VRVLFRGGARRVGLGAELGDVGVAGGLA
jgi:hypothetical protein